MNRPENWKEIRKDYQKQFKYPNWCDYEAGADAILEALRAKGLPVTAYMGSLVVTAEQEEAADAFFGDVVLKLKDGTKGRLAFITDEEQAKEVQQ